MEINKDHDCHLSAEDGCKGCVAVAEEEELNENGHKEGCGCWSCHNYYH
jgi:hypothetical protein